MAVQGLDLSSLAEEQPYASVETSPDNGSSRIVASGVNMNSLLEETNQLQEVVTVLESHPSLEKLLNEHLQQRMRNISKKYASFVALATTCGFIVGALVATCIILFLGKH
jgi:hypothetical protein